MRSIPLVIVAVVASPLMTSLEAQAQPPQPARAVSQGQPTAPAPAAILASLQDQLRNLVSAQESYFGRNHKYTNSLKELGYKAVAGAVVMVFRADNGGWAGRAVHPELPGRSCVIWVGPTGEMAKPTTDHQRRTGAEGVPACDAL